nr:MAG: coat protein [Leviviridae sp.]
MSLTISTKTYVVDRVQPDTVRYAGPANTPTVKDFVILGRTAAKGGSGIQVARFWHKTQKTVVVNATTGEMQQSSGNLELVLPIGMASADVDTLLADIASFLTSTAGKDAIKKAAINL